MKREFVPGSRNDFSMRRSPSSSRPSMPFGPPPIPPKAPAAKPSAPPKPASSRTEFVVRLTPSMLERINAALAGVPDSARDGAVISLLDDGLLRRAALASDKDKEKDKGAANLRFGLAFCNRLLKLIETEGVEKGVEFLKQRIAEMEGPAKEADPSEARWVQFTRLAELISGDVHVTAERRSIAGTVAAQIKAGAKPNGA